MKISRLTFPWQTADPFLFCAFHQDNFPAGNENLGPNESLAGRNIGQDFSGKDGWNMYHGDVVPGFPPHPHKGFETVTIAKKGMVDHSDSLGATGRFGDGDVQWMTAGKGVQHAEMFPLVNSGEPNPLVLFQIWLNLPSRSKNVEPYYAMIWHEDLKSIEKEDEEGRKTFIELVCGKIGEVESKAPAPDSWAADPDNEVAIWTFEMEPGAEWTLPDAGEGINRFLYFYRGDQIEIGEESTGPDCAIELTGEKGIKVENTGSEKAFFLYLQGRPINEPVTHYGPFVMNTAAEIQQAIMDYQQTQFGGWPWPPKGKVHPRDQGRFAIYADGTEESRDT